MRWNRCIENKSIGDILEIVKNVKKGYISYIPHNIGRINSTSGAGPGEKVVPCSREVNGEVLVKSTAFNFETLDQLFKLSKPQFMHL